MELTTFGTVSLMAFLAVEGQTYAGAVHEKLGLPRNTISTTMSRMETQGWAESWYEVAPWKGPARRMFKLTPTGRAVAESRLVELAPLIAVIAEALRHKEERAARFEPPTAQEEVLS